ncbi:MAG: serine hydrolase domain-containing protein [Microthrixaceae bacterium]
MSASAGLDALAGWPGDRRAAGWVHRDGRRDTRGDALEVFRLASVTKLLTATAVLVAVEEEVIDLDEPAGPPGSTVRLLLCHASGLPFEGRTPITEPGRRRIYGNAAFEVLGALVTERSGMGFETYVQEAVCGPLGMTSTTVSGSPAHGGRSTVEDLLCLCRELLEPTVVLAPATVTEATTAQLPDLDGVLPGYGRQSPNPWGLGFELHGRKEPHWMPPAASADAFGHFGQSGAFLWVDPTPGVACVALSEVPFGRWAIDAWPALGAAVLALFAT